MNNPYVMRTRFAVCEGIVRAIRAQSDTDGAAAWIHFCVTAADEAYASVMDSPPVVEGGLALRTQELLAKLSWEGGGTEPPFAPPQLDGADLRAAAHAAASEAYKRCMPQLTGRRRAQAYIACVAVGAQRRYLNKGESSALLYTAQLALSAYPKRNSSKARKQV